MSSHEAIAEWLKNVRRAYQPDRANVAEKHRAAMRPLKDRSARGETRIGLPDVGDPQAWGRGSR